MLRTSVCLLAGARLGAAQGPLSNDVAVLLAFKAHGNNAQATNPSYHSYANPRPGELALDTWVSGGDPCDDGTYDQIWAGWHRVKCCEAYDDTTCTGSNTHRVTYLNLGGTAVDGDVSGLAGLAQLSSLYLGDTAVDGDVSGLAGLAQLSSLHLDGTGCYGDSSVVSVSGYFGADHCSSSHDACPAGRTPVSSPDTYVGSNACACCSGTQKLLDSGTGACVDPGA